MPISPLPLAVDLDGTLVKIDTLHETAASVLLSRPAKVLGLIASLAFRGRAAFKAKLAEFGTLDTDYLPLRTDFVHWLEGQAALGRPLHLVSAADQSIVDAIAARLTMFASWRGSDGTNNLKGENKAAYLAKTFPDGFVYAGDSAADLAVWQKASGIVLVGASASVIRRAEALGRPIEARFDNKTGILRALLKEMRLHQWSKNVLVFLPIVLAHHFGDKTAWISAVLAFLGVGIAASATYIVNDLFDLSADRRHATKRKRPLASGALPVAVALPLVPLMLAAGLGLTALCGWATFGTLVAYIVLTLSYSFRFKRVPLFDTAIIGMLFTLRILLGCAAAGLMLSPWLMAFSVMLFFSLAMAKRQTELVKKADQPGGHNVAGRGYTKGDVQLSLVYGVTSGVASLVILMLYTTNGVAAGLYRNPNWLWAVPMLIYLWQMRVWLFAHRGILDDDPIVFAIKDRVSLLLGAGCAAAFYLAL